MPSAPIAPRRPSVLRLHGEERLDDYAWLRTRDSAEVQAWLEREEEYARQALAPLEPLRQLLYEELYQRLPVTHSSPPARREGFLYYSREEQGLPRPVHCRRRDLPEAPEEVLIDENALAGDNAAFCLGGMALSPDQQLLLFTVDETGAERFTLRVKDLRTGRLLEDVVEGAGACVAWAANGHSFFYVALDEALRADRLHRHVLGTNSAQDVLLFHERDETFRLSVGLTESGTYVKLVTSSRTSSEVWLLPANQPEAPLYPVAARRPRVFYDVTHRGESLYILINDTGANSRVMVAPARAPRSGPWRELVPHRDEVMLCHLQAFAHHLVLHVRKGGFRQLEVLDLREEQWPPSPHSVPLPEPVHTVLPADNLEFHSTTLRLGYASPTSPECILEYDMESHQVVLVEQCVVPGHDPRDYQVIRLEATAPDGERIPVSLIHHRALQHDGSNPLVLYGYGAYGLSVDPGFSFELLPLLDKGVLFAIAHVRGGSELGRHWHEQGRLLHKPNSISDFLACAEHLVKAGYTSPGLIAAMGESAGGTLVGAAINQRPELFGAVVAEVPFTDVVDTLLDDALPFTPEEWEEWGNPRQLKHYQSMKAYSPYDNVRSQPYPAMLVTTALQDSRVPFWEPARWVARLRAATTSSHPVVLHLLRTGHAGATGRQAHLWETALRHAFLLKQIHPLPFRAAR